MPAVPNSNIYLLEATGSLNGRKNITNRQNSPGSQNIVSVSYSFLKFTVILLKDLYSPKTTSTTNFHLFLMNYFHGPGQDLTGESLQISKQRKAMTPTCSACGIVFSGLNSLIKLNCIQILLTSSRDVPSQSQ